MEDDDLDDLIEAQREGRCVDTAPPPSPYAEIGLDDEITIVVSRGQRQRVFFTRPRSSLSGTLRSDEEGITWCRGHEVEAALSLLVTASLAHEPPIHLGVVKEASIAWPVDTIAIGYDDARDEFVMLDTGARISRKLIELHGWAKARNGA